MSTNKYFDAVEINGETRFAQLTRSVGDVAANNTIVTMDQAVTVNATSTPIAAANPDRRSIMLLNTGSNTVYVTTAATATTSHLPIEPGVSTTFEHTQAINGIVASGTGTVYVVEESA